MGKVSEVMYDRLEEIYSLYRLEQNFKSVKKKYEIKKKVLSDNIKKFLNEEVRDNEFEFENLNARYNVKNIVAKKIIWNPEKLEEKFDKEICNEIIHKEYSVIDMQGLIKYLKSCGVNPKKFKTFISVNKIVDEKAIEQLSSVGDISVEDVKGCFEVKESEGYIKINMKECNGK